MTEFTVEKFGRSSQGYFHAKVLIEDQPLYVHRRYGSWMAPGHIKGKPVLKEIPLVLKETLQVKARAIEKQENHDRPTPGSKDIPQAVR